jgi:hypothetical protein
MLETESHPLCLVPQLMLLLFVYLSQQVCPGSGMLALQEATAAAATVGVN